MYLCFRLTKTSTKYLTKDTTVRALLDECQALWPRLHATCRIGDNGKQWVFILLLVL
jgi:hypothetical protein